jgi:hypothetical protein
VARQSVDAARRAEYCSAGPVVCNQRGPMIWPASAKITTLLNRWNAGDAGARDELIPLVYRELRQVARGHSEASDPITRYKARRSCTKRICDLRLAPGRNGSLVNTSSPWPPR